MKVLVMLSICFAGVGLAHAELHTQMVEYKHADAVLEGYLVYDDASQGKRRVLVVHDWMGFGPYVKARADKLAKLGYVAFAADIYGKGVRPADSKEAAVVAGRYKGDRALLRARAGAALEVLRSQKLCDPKLVAAIGYCFGGTTMVEQSRSGAELSPRTTVYSYQSSGGVKAASVSSAKTGILAKVGTADSSVVSALAYTSCNVRVRVGAGVSIVPASSIWLKLQAASSKIRQ